MEITWYGHSCFRLRSREATVVTDPFGKNCGYEKPTVRTDIITISHDHENHSNPTGFRGKPKVVVGPGEYEIKGVFITGIATYHDGKKGAVNGKNTVYRYDMENLTVVHLGDLGHVPTQSQVEVLNSVDILFVPVGGGTTISPAQAAEVISLLEPRLVIPMHYKTPVFPGNLRKVEKFLNQMGLKRLEPQPQLKVTRSSLPEETQVVLLNYA
jgi:L-ascorbate metabolism protein UlaG (beta-lactamase superfamily)